MAMHISCNQKAVRQCYEWQGCFQAMRLLVGFIVPCPESTAKHVATLQACTVQCPPALQKVCKKGRLRI